MCVGALPSASTAPAPKTVGRYLLFDEIAAGGMATVHLARLMGPIGFARTVAIKRIHRHLARDTKVRSMFIDEARMAARVRHPNVVPVLDVIASDGELLLVMDYVHGESLARLAPLSSIGVGPVPVPIASAILIGVLHGLHAAHEAKDEKGQPLELVHRDVSPQNILVGLDGVPRVVDFGIAKAAGRLQTTADGQLKGKAGYLAPEQIVDAVVDRRTDVYGASVVLWELLVGRRLFDGEGAASTLHQVLHRKYEAPSRYAPAVPAEVDRLVMRGLAREPDERFASAWDMAAALEMAAPPASVRQMSEWVEGVAGERLRRRAQRIADIESASSSDLSPTAKPGESQDRIPTMLEARGPASASSPPPPSAVSDVSSLSLATLARPAVTRRTHAKRFAAAALVLGALSLGGLAIFGASRSRKPRIDPHSQAAATLSTPASEPVAAEAPAQVTATPTATASVPAPPAPAIVSSVGPRPSPPTSAKPRGVRRVPTHPVGPNCAVPFTWSPDGTKIPKAECL
jgi:serine/threonine-protein kinase